MFSSTPQGTHTPDISYAGPALSLGPTYYLRMKFWDTGGAQGDWSTATSTFTLGNTSLIQNIFFTYDAFGAMRNCSAEEAVQIQAFLDTKGCS